MTGADSRTAAVLQAFLPAEPHVNVDCQLYIIVLHDTLRGLGCELPSPHLDACRYLLQAAVILVAYY